MRACAFVRGACAGSRLKKSLSGPQGEARHAGAREGRLVRTVSSAGASRRHTWCRKRHSRGPPRSKRHTAGLCPTNLLLTLFLAMAPHRICTAQEAAPSARARDRDSVLPVSWEAVRHAGARRWRRAAAVTVLSAALAAVVFSVALRGRGSAATQRVALFEGYSLSSGEDAALRQLYDGDGERVPAAVIAAQAEADADLPQQARSAVRRARENLRDVQRAATAAAVLKGVGKDAHFSGAAWEAEMDKALAYPPRDHAAPPKRAAMLKNAVAAGYGRAAREEQTQDTIKEEMESALRRKLSGLKLDVQRQLREEKEAAVLRARIQQKAMHSDMQELKERLLRQREKMDGEMVKLKTKERYYKSEHEKDVEGVAGAARGVKKANTDDDQKRKTRETEDIHEKKLESEVKKLRADQAKEIARLKAMEASVSSSAARPKHVQKSATGVYPEVMKIEDEKSHQVQKIEERYFQHVISAEDARKKMAHVVIVQEARKAAEAVKAQNRAREATAESGRAMHRVQTLQTLPLRADQPTAAQPARAPAAQPEQPKAESTLPPAAAILTAASETRPAAPDAQGAGDADALLKTKLQEAVAQRDAAQAALDSFLLEAKDREITVLERELALNQRVLALRQMEQTSADGASLLPGLEQQEESYKEGLALASGQAASVVLPPALDIAMQPPARTADYLGRPAVVWEPRGTASGMNFGDKFEVLPPRAPSAAATRLSPDPQPVAPSAEASSTHVRTVSSGVPVDRVPEWSPRVKSLKERALKAGYKLVPLAQQAHQRHVSPEQAPAREQGTAQRRDDAHGGEHSTQEPSVVRARASVFKVPAGEQTLAAAKAPQHHQRSMLAPPTNAGPTFLPPMGAALTSPTAASDEAQKTDDGTRRQDVRLGDAPAAAPAGMEGASLLDQMGELMYECMDACVSSRLLSRMCCLSSTG